MYYHHTIFINIFNKVINHIVEKSENDGEYKVVYSMAAGMFRISYYSETDNKKEVEKYVLGTFRQQEVEKR